MGKIGDLWVRLGLKKDEFTAGLDAAQKQSQTFGQKVGSVFKDMAAKAVALTAAFAAIGRGIADAIKNIAGFERANSELAAVLGTNIAGVKELSDSARDLGRTSEFTASEVTQLQVALARLGFDTGQIQNMQKSVLDFALAMGTDLGSAAEFTGSALRAFGLQATDTQRLLDIMSASTTNSALNFSKLQTSVAYVFPIAKEFGLTIEETAAFLGVLSNNGYDASMAATALRSILVNLTSDNGKFAKGIGHTAKSFDEIIASFKELKERGIELGETNDLVGQRAVGAMAALIRQGDSVTDLKKKLEDANGSLEKMAQTMGDNLEGSVKALKSAWEGLTLQFEKSKGPMQWVVERLTDILNRLTDIMGGDKVSFWEAVLGPLAGGAIKGLQDRNKEANTIRVTSPESIPAGGPDYKPREAGTSGATAALSEEELAEREKQRKKAMQELQEAARAAGEEARGLVDEEEEMLKMERENLALFERMHGVEKPAIFDNDTWRMIAINAKEAIENGEDLLNLTERLDAGLDECAAAATADLQKMQQASDDLAQAITENLVSAIEDGLVGAFNALADVIGGVTDGGMEQVLKALVEPLAEMAIKTGTLVMMSGLAIDKLLNALRFAGNPLGAVAAGAALVAVGVAAKAGLAAIGNHGNSGTGISSVSSSASPYGGATGVQSAELVVRVEGAVKGSDIILSGQNTLKNWNR